MHPGPIHRLPSEILVLILLYTEINTRLYKLARVCQLWADLISRTPEFWTCIWANGNYDELKRYLKLSRDASLDIHFESAERSGDYKQPITRWEMSLHAFRDFITDKTGDNIKA